MQTIRLTVCIYANYQTRTGSMNADLHYAGLYVCKVSDYGRLYPCRPWHEHVFSPLQGMDASGEPLLQFKFRVQFYVETHLLLRYVCPHLCCLHHLLPSASLPCLALIALSTASPIVTTCTLLIVLYCRLHHLFSPLCPHPPPSLSSPAGRVLPTIQQVLKCLHLLSVSQPPAVLYSYSFFEFAF